MASKLCPECLSSLDADEPQCPHCGATQPGRRARSRGWRVAGAVALVSAGTAAVLMVLDSTGEPVLFHRDVAAPAPADPGAATPVDPASPPRHHWLLASEDDAGAVAAALVLRGPAGGPPTLLLPLSAVPVRGGLRDVSGEPVELRVLGHNLEHGFVLLTPQRAPPDGVEPLPAGASTGLPTGCELAVLAPGAGALEPAHLAGRSADGRRLLLDRELPPAAALLADGRAVGYAAGPREAIPLDRVAPWLGRAGTRELAVVQRELREWNPEHVRAEIKALLGEGASARDVRRAIELLDRLALSARGREQLAELDHALRAGHLALVRLLAGTDAGRALQEAELALARFPDHRELLEDAIGLAIEAGDPGGAARLLRQLRALAPERAAPRAEAVADALRRSGDGLVEQRRFQEGLALLGEAVQLLPGRADLHARLARALAVADRPAEALAAMQRAARLDAGYEGVLEGYREAAERARDPGGTVAIPIDRATGSIRAEVRVGGEPLEFIVDTGATHTTVPTALVRRLGLWRPGLPVARVTTAGGVVEAEVVRLPELTIGPLRVRRVRAVAIDLPGSLAGKGLLGLNVLQRLNMRLDSERGQLILEKSPRSRR